MRHTSRIRSKNETLKSATANAIDVRKFRCPKCGAYMDYISAREFYNDKTRTDMMLVCRKDDVHCKTRKSKSGNVYLVSTPADPVVRALRQEAHYYFDKLHDRKLMAGKDSCYEWLSMQLGYPTYGRTTFRHIGEMDEMMLKKTILLCVDYLYNNRDRLQYPIGIYRGPNSYTSVRADIVKKLQKIREEKKACAAGKIG